jgi:hypothetical protein
MEEKVRPMFAQYAHVLLFACPLCGRPLASACFNTKLSLEDADAHWFTPHCHCGWTGDVSGVSAVKHWVAPWHSNLPIGNDVAGSCDDAQLDRNHANP